MSITLQINGRTIQAESGQTILQAARAHEIYIPTLCDMPELTPHGSCRMCIVEVEGRPNTPTACTTLVSEGMVVHTETAQVRGLRKEILRMLLADHPTSCLFCPEGGNCEECMVTLHKSGVITGCRTCPSDGQCSLQQLVSDYELESVGYPVRYRGLEVKKEDPFFDRDNNLCILCGRCVNVCASLHFNPVQVYVKRGSHTQVGTGFDSSHLEAGCSFCGACLDACPTGALSEKTRKWDGKPDAAISSFCPFCSLGCEVSLQIKRDPAEMILGAIPASPDQNLCVKGRFGVTELVNHPQRLSEVLQVEQGQAARVGWDEAFQLAAGHLAACRPEQFSMLVSASCTNEELYLADQFSRRIMGVPAILDAGARYGSGLAAVNRLLKQSKGLETLETVDVIVLLGMDLHYSQSPIEKYLLKAAKRGAKLISVYAGSHVPGQHADVWLKPEIFSEKAVLAALLDPVQAGRMVDAARLVNTAEHAVLVAGPDYLARFPQALERLHQESRAEILAIPAEGNLPGALKLGLGEAPAENPPRVLYVVGSAIPVDLPEDCFVIYQNTHLPAKMPCQGVYLPMAGFGETAGSIIGQNGSLRHLAAAIQPIGKAQPGWQILTRLAQSLQKPGFDFSCIDEVSLEMKRFLEQGAPEPNYDRPWPLWLDVPGEHDFLGVDLSTRVAGLAQLFAGRSQPLTLEGKHVYSA